MQAAPKEGRIKGAKRCEYNGITFDSARERDRWVALSLMQMAGEIGGLDRQVRIPLYGRDGPIRTPTGQQMHYVADFTYVDFQTASSVVEDAKGHPSDTYLMKRAILAAQGVEVREV